MLNQIPRVELIEPEYVFRLLVDLQFHTSYGLPAGELGMASNYLR